MLEINPNLVMSMMQVIDLSASKGVFTGKDLTAVGEIRRQLEEVLAPVTNAAKELEAQRLAEEAAAKTQAEYEASLKTEARASEK